MWCESYIAECLWLSTIKGWVYYNSYLAIVTKHRVDRNINGNVKSSWWSIRMFSDVQEEGKDGTWPKLKRDVKVSDRVDLEIMAGLVGLLGSAMGVMRKGEVRKGEIYQMWNLLLYTRVGTKVRRFICCNNLSINTCLYFKGGYTGETGGGGIFMDNTEIVIGWRHFAPP